MSSNRKYKVKHIYIGEHDVQEWTEGVGKYTLMPLMFNGIKKLVENKLKKYQFARVECVVRKQKKAFDFFINEDGVWDSLEKCMEWAIEEEEYELCSEIKKLEEHLDKDNTF
jgi:hypothetical protein